MRIAHKYLKGSDNKEEKSFSGTTRVNRKRLREQ